MRLVPQRWVGRWLRLAIIGMSAAAAVAAPPVGAATLSGTIHYTGAHGPVSATRPILLFLWDTSSPQNDPVAMATVTSNGGSFALSVATAGTYYMAYGLDVPDAGDVVVGDPYGVYNHHSGFPSDPITVPQAGIGLGSLTFDDSGILPGIAGTLTYTGSEGSVSDTTPIIIESFSSADLSGSSQDEQSIQVNGGGYSAIIFDSAPRYLRAYLDVNGNDQYDTGEPFEIYNARTSPPADPVVPGTTQTAVDFSFGDPAGSVHLTGTINYTGAQGPVSATQPLGISLVADANLQGDKVAKAVITEPAGNFDLVAPTAGQYYMGYYLDLNGDGQASVGEPFRIYNNRSSPPGDPISVPRAGIALPLDDSTLFSGISGTVTYNGSYGPISNSRQLVVQAYADPDLTEFVSSDQVSTNGQRYDIISFENVPCYLVAFVDINSDGQREAGEPYQIYQGKGSPPADAVSPSTTQTAIDFTFGDENIGGGQPCVGDCNLDNQVTVNEIITMVNIALGNAPVSACLAGDADGNGEITVNEIIAAVNHALNGC